MTGRWSTPAASRRNGPPRQGWRNVLPAALVPLGLGWLAAAWLGLVFAPSGMAVDALLVLGLLAACVPAMRGPRALWTLAIVLVLVGVVAHAFKLAQLRVPVLAGDVTSAIALLKVLSGWRLALAIAVLAGLAAALAWALWPRRGRAWRLLLPAALLGALVLAAHPLSQGLERLAPVHEPENLVERLQRHGGLMFLLEDYAAFRRDQLAVPTREEVRAALGGLSSVRFAAAPGFRPRNVHLVLLETAWDPLKLTRYRFSRDPFDPRFRHALESAGNSSVIVPGFGGATANAEFEALCGLPANREKVAFDHALERSMPCLPRLLRDAGYLTQASHPYEAGFWNRDHAYPLLGFERYYPVNAFELDDMDGMFLADGSAYRQVRERLAAPEEPRPVFNYVVSLSSHFPYERDVRKRPDRVAVTPRARLLEGYANAMAYSTEAFMDYVDAVHLADPDALIVAFGDHAPALGHAPDPYAESGIDMSSRLGMRASEALPDSPTLARTPLLVFDGRRGVVPVGDVPLFAIPDLVLTRLGEGAPESLYTALLRAGEPVDSFRLFLGHMLVKREGQWQLCTGKVALCDRARSLRERLVVLRQDLAQGEQHALALLGGESVGREVAMSVERTFADCGLAVRAWGPQSFAAGEAFNHQPDGSSSFWFQFESARGKPELQVGEDTRVPMTIAGKVGSAGFRPEQVARFKDGDAVRWVCPDGGSGEIGRLAVRSAPAAAAGDAAGAGAACDAGIAGFGPRRVRVGEPFNVQPGGRSAFWLNLAPGSQGFALFAAGEPLAFTRAGDTISFLGEGALARALERPGQVPLELRCGDRVLDTANIEVEGEAAAAAAPPSGPLPPPPPTRFVAHAGGLAHGWNYTNSREALDASHARGFRLFEIDLSWTRDGHLVLIHDWAKTWKRYFGGGDVPTRDAFLAAPMRHGLRTLALEDALDWLRRHGDAMLVTDVKERNLEALARIAEAAGPLRERIVPQVYEPEEIAPAKALGFPRVILTVYRSTKPPAQLVAGAREAGAWALTVPQARAQGGDFDAALSDPALFVFAHTVNEPADWRALRERGVDGIYTDLLIEAGRD